MVAVVPDGVNVCIFYFLCKAHYHGVCIGSVSFELSLLLRKNLVRHTCNIRLRVPVGQRGALSAVTSPGSCRTVSIGIRRVSIWVGPLLGVPVQILLRTI